MQAQTSGNLMSEGVIWKKIICFAMPIFLGNLFQQLYNTADSLIVGNFLGSHALAAVSSSGNLIFLMIGFFNGIAMGAGVLIAQCFGAKRYETMQKAIHTTARSFFRYRFDNSRRLPCPDDLNVDGYTNKCHGAIRYLFSDLFHGISWPCHVQYFCWHSAGSGRQ